MFQFEVDHNQNYITKCAEHSDEDEHAHPSYSDVISSNAPGDGLYIFIVVCVQTQFCLTDGWKSIRMQ